MADIAKRCNEGCHAMCAARFPRALREERSRSDPRCKSATSVEAAAPRARDSPRLARREDRTSGTLRSVVIPAAGRIQSRRPALHLTRPRNQLGHQERTKMPNVAALLKQEITRLARKEVRGATVALKKASAQHRRAIAALRRQIAQAQRQLATLARRLERGTGGGAPAAPEEPKVRFVARGLRSHRARLGLSAAEYGKLVGVSAQSIYNWEQGAARPRAAQLATLVALRGIGKREAQARLQQLAQASGKERKRRTRR
ncbi:MAG: helix-turn-helix domain-containing protein [Burkholderiaceae bacterium]